MKTKPKNNNNIGTNICPSAPYNYCQTNLACLSGQQTDPDLVDFAEDELEQAQEADAGDGENLYSEFESKKSEHENQVLEAEKDTILANESQILYSIETSKFDPSIYANFRLGSNSSTLDISPGQWV